MIKGSRRSFLKHAMAIGGAAGLSTFSPRFARAATQIWGTSIPGFSELVPTPSENTGEMLLALPEGFKYNILSRTGQVMSDGRPTPSNADGMGAFQYGNTIRIVRNHERDGGPVQGNPALAYDTSASGGTTTLTVDPVTRMLLEDFVSLGGTIRNCAGGTTPWGTWITCEETNAYRAGTMKQHGYCFEVPAFATGQVAAVPLAGMGLLYPEAVAIDPSTGIAYITMDRNPSGLFRFIPNQYGVLSGSGKLQMLAVQGMPQLNTSIGAPLNVKLPVTWVDITSPTPEAAYRADSLVAFKEGFLQNGASFSRLEGAWHSRNSIFFASTSGGIAGFGQIFELHLKNKDRQELELIFESTDREQLDAPDNIAVSPSGNNLILCEDGSGSEYLHLLRKSGNQIYRFAKNIVPGQEGSEWAGACFSPDGKTLFANIQGAGMTFAIWTEHWGTIN
jgi:secreted PhoX family phosphatase